MFALILLIDKVVESPKCKRVSTDDVPTYLMPTYV